MDRVRVTERETVEAVDGVHLTQLAGSEGMSVQHFHIEAGATVPEHSHPHEQTGWIESGEGVFVLSEEEVAVRAGDSYAIPGDEPHALEVSGREPLVGVDIFHPPREAPSWGE